MGHEVMSLANRPKFRRKNRPQDREDTAQHEAMAARVTEPDQPIERPRAGRAEASKRQAGVAGTSDPGREDRAREMAERKAIAKRRAAEKIARERVLARKVARASEDEGRRRGADGTVRGATAGREAAVAPSPLTGPVMTETADIWQSLDSFALDELQMDRKRIITASRHDPAHTAFDVLRTRLLQALAENGWRRVAITSPTKDCGKTFTAANLAISLSRQQNCRAILLDCDLRHPTLHNVMGVSDPGSMGDMLRGKVSPAQHLRRLGKNTFDAGDNIAFGFNGVCEPYAAELLQDPRSSKALRRIEADFAPDVILFDLPPALVSDDVIALRPEFDGVLLVIGGGLTTQKEVKEVERRLGDTPLLGTVLNKAEGSNVRKYSY